MLEPATLAASLTPAQASVWWKPKPAALAPPVPAPHRVRHQSVHQGAPQVPTSAIAVTPAQARGWRKPEPAIAAPTPAPWQEVP